MKLKALTSFSGAFTMAVGEVAICSNEEIAADLIHAGYAVEVSEEPPKKTVKKGKKNENQ